jgi:anti-sigma B factor antagonist
VQTRGHSVADALDASRLLPMAAAAGPLDPEPFRIERLAVRGCVLVAPIGELDLATAGPLHDLLTELTADEPDVFVLDLSRLSFMDCSGLRVVLETQLRARHAGLPLSVVCGPGQVRRLLALSDADGGLDIIEHPAQPQMTTRTQAGS